MNPWFLVDDDVDDDDDDDDNDDDDDDMDAERSYKSASNCY